MKYLYSTLTNAFYPMNMKEIYQNAGSWPKDAHAREVDEDIYIKFTGLSPVGMQRIAGDDGMPTWQDVPPLSQDEIVAKIKATKQQLIDTTNAYITSKQWQGKAALGRLKSDELMQYNTWLDYLDALEIIEVSSEQEIVWPIQPDAAAN